MQTITITLNDHQTAVIEELGLSLDYSCIRQLQGGVELVDINLDVPEDISFYNIPENPDLSTYVDKIEDGGWVTYRHTVHGWVAIS